MKKGRFPPCTLPAAPEPVLRATGAREGVRSSAEPAFSAALPQAQERSPAWGAAHDSLLPLLASSLPHWRHNPREDLLGAGSDKVTG